MNTTAIVVDLIILIIFLIYAIDGYRRGFLLLAVELIGTIAGLVLAYRWAEPVGEWLRERLAGRLTIPESAGESLGFVVIWLAFEAIYLCLSSWLYARLPAKIRQSLVNKLLGLIPSTLKGLAMIVVITTLLVIIPIEHRLRPAILESRLGEPLVKAGQTAQQELMRRYQDQLTDTFTFLTTTPFVKKIDGQTTKSVQLPFRFTEGIEDPASENEMLKLVNQERAKEGLKALAADPALAAVGRRHASDMLVQGYFSHVNPANEDPFDRLNAAKINYLTAGENLAFAPTVQLAHIGLMNSPAHRDNILFPDFGRLGVAAVKAGYYGIMFVQLFRD